MLFWGSLAQKHKRPNRSRCLAVHLPRIFPVFAAIPDPDNMPMLAGGSATPPPIPRDETISDLAAWPLKEFIETTPSSMAMFDTDMCYLAVSRQFLVDNEITGETQQSIVGRSVFEFRKATDGAREVNRRVLSGETLIKEDFSFRRPDGSAVWMRWQMQPWRLPDRSIGGALLTMEIVQARKQTEDRLEASESLLRLSQEAGHIGSYDWDVGAARTCGPTSSAACMASSPPADNPYRSRCGGV